MSSLKCSHANGTDAQLLCSSISHRIPAVWRLNYRGISFFVVSLFLLLAITCFSRLQTGRTQWVRLTGTQRLPIGMPRLFRVLLCALRWVTLVGYTLTWTVHKTEKLVFIDINTHRQPDRKQGDLQQELSERDINMRCPLLIVAFTDFSSGQWLHCDSLSNTAGWHLDIMAKTL